MIKLILLLLVTGMILLVGGVKVFGAIVVDDPEQLIGTGTSQYIRMIYGDNLMERIDGMDYVVDKGDGEYYILLAKDVGDGIVFGAYVETDNVYSNSGTSGYEGWCNGRIDRGTFLEGSSPDYALGIYDPDGGQFALLYDSGALVFDENLTSWESGMSLFPDSGWIEYNGVLGGIVGGLVFEGGDTIIFEHTVLVTPPVILDSPGNGSVGIDPNTSLVWQGKAASEFNVHLYDDKGGPVYVFPGLTDTSLDVNGYLDWNTTYNWQIDEVIGGIVTYSSPVWTFTTIDYECQSILVGDWNGDCVVNFVDFAMMANNWLDEVPKVAAGSGG